MRATILLPAVLLLAGPAVRAAPPERPVVVELFTSEGCSSCPPAEALLTELARRPDILPLSFHVTYWNGLGWRDPFSFDAATERQRHYSARLGLDGVYTPQMVVEGRTDVVGFDRQAVEGTIKNANARTAVPVRVAREGDQIAVELGGGTEAGTAWLVGFDTAHTTAVGRGENAGRTLHESNIVRSL